MNIFFSAILQIWKMTEMSYSHKTQLLLMESSVIMDIKYSNDYISMISYRQNPQSQLPYFAKLDARMKCWGIISYSGININLLIMKRNIAFP